MPREDGRNREDEGRTGPPERDDFGQAGSSSDYAHDPAGGQTHRGVSDEDREHAGRMNQGDGPRDTGPRAWMERAGQLLSGAPRADAPPRRPGPSDRVLWAVIVERLEDERRLDLRDVEVIVEGGEVTLNGTVRRKEDKRRIEDVADIDGVGNVQNNLRVRDRDPWTFL